MKPTDFNIPKEKLQFKKNTGPIHDQKLETKPIGYFKDAWNRFKKNKASIVATVIIGILILFALIVPIFSKYKVSYADDPKYPAFKFALPKSDLFSSLGVDFWDGCKNNSLEENAFLRLKAIQTETNTPVIKSVKEVVRESYFTEEKVTYYFRQNSYYIKGVEYRNVSLEEYERIQKYQDETGKQVIYPIIDEKNEYYHGNEKEFTAFKDDGNMWYVTERDGGVYVPKLDEDGNFINMYLTTDKYYDYTYDGSIKALSKNIDDALTQLVTYGKTKYELYTYLQNEGLGLDVSIKEIDTKLKGSLKPSEKQEYTRYKEMLERTKVLIAGSNMTAELARLESELLSATEEEKVQINSDIEAIKKSQEFFSGVVIKKNELIAQAEEKYNSIVSAYSFDIIVGSFEENTKKIYDKYVERNGNLKDDIAKNVVDIFDVNTVTKHSDIANSFIDGSPNDKYTSKVRINGDDGQYMYAQPLSGNMFKIRVSFYEYYVYYHQIVRNDGVTRPYFLFGTTDSGQDILTCLASGARFSLILSICVATINLVVGAIIGAIEGYYGGKIDLIIERIIDILSAVPFMIVITLLKYHLQASHVIVLFIAFFLTGWIGMAGRTRMQFYRFKNQEYVLVARTLGASDKRIMFKHIFPNAIGTLITSCVLVIPGVIFSETSLSYLGIINLETGNLISVGTLLAKGNTYLFTYPHIILTPALFISLLELSFNLFGNGLRDAFNPSLRGTEE